MTAITFTEILESTHERSPDFSDLMSFEIEALRQIQFNGDSSRVPTLQYS